MLSSCAARAYTRAVMGGFDIEAGGARAVEFMNAGLDLQDALQALPEGDREHGAALALQAAAAFSKALNLSPEVALSALKLALAPRLTRTNNVPERTALFLLGEVVWAIEGDDDARASLEHVFALLQRVDSPGSNTLKIRDIACEVELLLTATHHPDAGVDEHDIAGKLLEFLKARFGEEVEQRLSKDAIADWLSRYSASQARGKLTLAGIVANIIRKGELAGVRRTQPHCDVVARVQKALK